MELNDGDTVTVTMLDPQGTRMTGKVTELPDGRGLTLATKGEELFIPWTSILHVRLSAGR